MLAREEVDVRDPLRVERGLVAAARSPRDLREMESIGPIDLVQQRGEARAGAHAVDRQGILAEPADHVEVDHGGGLAHGHDRIVHIMAAAPKAPFLAREENEDHRAAELLRPLGQGPGNLQHHGHRPRRCRRPRGKSARALEGSVL